MKQTTNTMKAMETLNSSLIIDPKIDTTYAKNSFLHEKETKVLRTKTGSKRGRVRETLFKVHKGNVLGEIGKVGRDLKNIFTQEKIAEEHNLTLPLPHIHGGYYIAQKDRAKYEVVVDAANAEVQRLKRQIARDYPYLVSEGRAEMGVVMAATVTYPTSEELTNTFNIGAAFRQDAVDVGACGALAGWMSETLNKGAAVANEHSTLKDKAIAKFLEGLAKEMDLGITNMQASMSKKGGRVRNENVSNILTKVEQIKEMTARYGISNHVADAISKVCNTVTSNLGTVDMSVITAPPEREEILAKIEADQKIVTTTAANIMKW